MIISNICNQQQSTNFGAQIEGNYYLRKGVRRVVKEGTLEDNALLLGILKVIKKDSSIKTFKMNSDIVSLANKTIKYIFTIDGNDMFTQPFINKSAVRDEGDEHFLDGLSWFVKEHYGDTVHKRVVKNVSKFLEKGLSVPEETKQKLIMDMRKTLNLEPQKYILSKNGKKIPVTPQGVPDENYVC